MNIIWQALWFVVAVGLLITVHEFGHYWVARRFGFKVLRFSVGFGKPLWTWIGKGPDRTEYVVAAIPLGGYVKVLNENDQDGPIDPADLPRSFGRRPPWQRILMLLAGPGFNIGFAILVLWAMLWANGVDEYKALVGEVVEGSVAAHGGLRSGDEILKINGTRVEGQREVVFDLLDSMTSNGLAVLAVRGREGGSRTATLAVSGAEERRKLTEPAGIFNGLGFQFWAPTAPAVVREVVAGGPAAKAGLKPGDTILSIDDRPVDVTNLISNVERNIGRTVPIRYRRAGTEGSAPITVADKLVDGHHVGRIDFSFSAPPGTELKYPPEMRTHVDYSPGVALVRASGEAWDMVVLQARLFWRMAIGHVSVKMLGGPLSIAEFAGDSANAGVAPFLEFLVMISLSLGFLNLLPIPILDGGQIVFQAAEWLKGSPVSERAQAFGQQVGIALLILLMGVALFNDIARQLG